MTKSKKASEIDTTTKTSELEGAHHRLTQFLYDLMRDHVPFGTVEKLVQELTDDEVTYTNQSASSYANEVASRILKPQTEVSTSLWKPLTSFSTGETRLWKDLQEEEHNTIYGAYIAPTHSNTGAHGYKLNERGFVATRQEYRPDITPYELEYFSGPHFVERFLKALQSLTKLPKSAVIVTCVRYQDETTYHGLEVSREFLKQLKKRGKLTG